ncbi:hypothetical protein Cgig2_029359 [Carnegiea gigantea]|uniref:EXS domain-containing protein n=1 Tax=Carnegiea gigantea TaxID=171969 RepID=A0A9Q1QPQ0_9CARY|nr:hypothetical protein Cgig2_029359 [Carnegiea gigantea]
MFNGYLALLSTKRIQVLLYIAAVMLLIFPFDIFYLSSRYYLLKTLWRIVLPLQASKLFYRAITFSDFFLADILTSMSKVATIAWFEADSVCGSHSVMIPLVLVLPYLFRLFQCLRQYKDTGEKSSLLNALKYSTAVPVIFLSALKYHVFPDKWTDIYRPLWLMSSVLNSMYSFYWDVTRDWDMRYIIAIISFECTLSSNLSPFRVAWSSLWSLLFRYLKSFDKMKTTLLAIDWIPYSHTIVFLAAVVSPGSSNLGNLIYFHIFFMDENG